MPETGKPMLNMNSLTLKGRVVLRWLPAVGIVAAANHLSAIPQLRVVPDSWLPLWLVKRLAAYSLKIGTSGFFSYTLSLQPEFIVRKLGHFGLFSLLGAAVCFAARSKRTAVLLAVSFAVLDEVHQSFTPGRECRFGDILLDSAAVVCGVLIMWRRLSLRRVRLR